MEHPEDGRIRARVCLSRGERAQVMIDDHTYEALLRGALLAEGSLPVTGDWVRVRHISPGQVLIEEVEPRATGLRRRAAGRASTEQVLAANVDLALIVCGLDADFNLRRLERYLALAHDGGVRPVVLLNKVDLWDGAIPEVPFAEVLPVSARTGAGLDAVAERLEYGLTAVMLGSSGAGKSSIVNWLLGRARPRTNGVREHDSRGRHTTTDRELIALPGGAWLIDTPGIREIQLLVGEDALDAVFDEIATLAHGCRFADCRHVQEPGCAVRDVVDRGRLESYHKLQRETHRLQHEQRAKARWKVASKAMRRFQKDRDKW